MENIYILVGIALFVMGIWGFIVTEHLIQKLISLNIFTSGIFLLFVAITYTNEKASSIATALVLTGLVVSLAAMALGIMLIRACYKSEK